ncbi:dihydrofolate reductase family protein [Shinella oryzae]|uniref:Dihydrofolate reductase family protein n=1 Tax=Shinella oryzae TaxID=2871820 RepID=A0ABY9K2M8_9HYPH|nr:dihydrofolate reductase family protein [Shinella oryzae]WLS02833.1 dihydrofolate reductase family protein [Shinella oryzae]
MRKLIVSAFISLDGVMQAPGGPQEDPIGGFRFGGWGVPYFDETAGAVIDELFARPFDLLLGRKTYDIFAAHWPYADANDPIGPLFDRVTKYVATRNPAFRTTWQNSRTLGADAVTAVKALKGSDGPDLLTQGSPDFLRTLFENDLVDEINVFVFPVILGKGKRLFGDASFPRAFTLESSRTSQNGIVISRYARAGDVTTGSFEFDTPTEAELERRRNLT